MKNPAVKKLQPAVKMPREDTPELTSGRREEPLLKRKAVPREQMLVDPFRADGHERVVQKYGNRFFSRDIREDRLNLILTEKSVGARRR